MAFNRQVTPPPPPGGGFALRPHRPLSHPDTRRRLVNGGARNTVPSPARIRLRMRALEAASSPRRACWERDRVRGATLVRCAISTQFCPPMRPSRQAITYETFVAGGMVKFLMVNAGSRCFESAAKILYFLRFCLQICVSKTPLILDLAPVNHEPKPLDCGRQQTQPTLIPARRQK